MKQNGVLFIDSFMVRNGKLRKCRIRITRDGFEYYPDDMDEDMIPICDALNELPGVRTFFCCSGHGRGKDEFYISLGCSNIRSLKLITRGFNVYGVRNTPPGCKPYRLEPDDAFWPLKPSEIGLRISNRWVSKLNGRDRRREFARVVKLLRDIAK